MLTAALKGMPTNRDVTETTMCIHLGSISPHRPGLLPPELLFPQALPAAERRCLWKKSSALLVCPRGGWWESVILGGQRHRQRHNFICSVQARRVGRSPSPQKLLPLLLQLVLLLLLLLQLLLMLLLERLLLLLLLALLL